MVMNHSFRLIHLQFLDTESINIYMKHSKNISNHFAGNNLQLATLRISIYCLAIIAPFAVYAKPSMIKVAHTNTVQPRYIFNKIFCYRLTPDSVAKTNLNDYIISFYESKISNLQIYSTTIHKDLLFSLVVGRTDPNISMPFYLRADTIVLCKFADSWESLDTLIIKGITRYHRLVIINDTLNILLWCYDGLSINPVLYKIADNKICEPKYLQSIDKSLKNMDYATFTSVGDYAFYLVNNGAARYLARTNLITYKTDTLVIDGSAWVEYNSLNFKNNNLYISNEKGIYKSADYGDSWTPVLLTDSLAMYAVNNKEEILYFKHEDYKYSRIGAIKSATDLDTINTQVSDTLSPLFWNILLEIYSNNDKFYIRSETGLFEVINDGNSMITDTTPTLIDFDRITKVEIFDLDGRLINTLYDARSLFTVCQGLKNTYYCVFHYRDGIVLKPYYFN